MQTRKTEQKLSGGDACWHKDRNERHQQCWLWSLMKQPGSSPQCWYVRQRVGVIQLKWMTDDLFPILQLATTFNSSKGHPSQSSPYSLSTRLIPADEMQLLSQQKIPWKIADAPGSSLQVRVCIPRISLPSRWALTCECDSPVCC